MACDKFPRLLRRGNTRSLTSLSFRRLHSHHRIQAKLFRFGQLFRYPKWHGAWQMYLREIRTMQCKNCAILYRCNGELGFPGIRTSHS